MVSVFHSCSHRELSVTHVTRYTISPCVKSKSRGGSPLHLLQNAALVKIHIHAAIFGPIHFSSSILPPSSSRSPRKRKWLLKPLRVGTCQGAFQHGRHVIPNTIFVGLVSASTCSVLIFWSSWHKHSCRDKSSPL